MATREGLEEGEKGVDLLAGGRAAETEADGAHADMALRDAIACASDSVLNRLGNTGFRVNRTYRSIPFLALSVSPGALEVLRDMPGVLSIVEDRPIHREVAMAFTDRMQS